MKPSGALQRIPVSQYDSTAKLPDLSNNDGCLAFQLIDGDGNFNHNGLEDFEREVRLSKSPSYAVVAVIGPQSTGKSTLLNRLFDTKFKVMDSSFGRSRTTQGIWLAYPNIEPELPVLVMDIEGADGSEREDDPAFEKQSALFTLAVADVVIVNIWCHDIGREQGASKPLLEAVFQQVKTKFCDEPRKITLMFVLRDQEQSPVEVLEDSLRANIVKIWDSIPMPTGSRNITLDEVFDVKVVSLPHYVYQKEDFEKEVLIFKKSLVEHCTAAGDQKLPTSEFSTIWKGIKENKNLDLPAHKVMVAKIRCEEIKTEKYDAFELSKDWFELRKATQLGNFGAIRHLWETVNSVLNTCVSEYDQEASYFSEEVRIKKRDKLVEELLQLVEPVYRAFLNHLRREHLKKFMEPFDKNSDDPDIFFRDADDHIQRYLSEFKKDSAAISIDLWKWDTLKETGELEVDMRSYIATKREDKLALKIKQIYEPKLKQELSQSVVHFLCEETDPTWSKIREHYKSLMNSTVSSLKETFLELGVNEDDQKEKQESLNKYAEDVIVAKTRAESGRAEEHMIKKFEYLFKQDSSLDWNSDEAVKAAAKNALHIPLMLLAGFVAIRLEDSDAADSIQYILASAFLAEYQNALKDLKSPTWAQIQSSKTLITPIQCKESWERFVDNATRITNQALGDLQREQKKKPKREQFLKVVEAISSLLAIAASILQIIVVLV